MTEATASGVWRTLSVIRSRAPLVHNITNLVVTNNTANALLAVGASPAMVEGADEVEEFARLADSLVINLGTMSAVRAAAMRLAITAANDAGTPWVMDPVAVGAIGYRTRLAKDLASRGPAVIRGNASEILALAEMPGPGGKGVDSQALAEAAIAGAQKLATRTGAAIAVTGATDYVIDGDGIVSIGNGHPMMTRVTGLGCTATALIGACIAVERNAVLAAAHGLALIGVAGEIAAEHARGPGSLQVELLDALHQLDEQSLHQRLKLTAPPLAAGLGGDADQEKGAETD